MGNQTRDEQLAEAAYRQLIEDFREVLEMKSGAGHRVLLNVLADCDVLTTPMRGNSSGDWTNFNIGRQDVGHRTLANIRAASPAAFTDLLLQLTEDESDAESN